MTHNLIPGQGSPVPLLKLQMTPRLQLLISFGSKKKEPRLYVWVKPRLGTRTKMWAEVSSSASNLLHKGLLVSPIRWRCLLRLCPVGRPMTNPGLCCVKVQKPGLRCQTGAWNQCLRMFLITTKTAPHYQILVIHPFYPSFYVLPRDPHGQLRSYKLLKRTVSCELIHVFISSYLSMSGDPVQSHYVLERDIIQRLSTMLYQWRHFGSLKGVQSHLTIRENTNIFLWPSIRLNFINTGQNGIHLRLENCSMLS